MEPRLIRHGVVIGGLITSSLLLVYIFNFYYLFSPTLATVLRVAIDLSLVSTIFFSIQLVTTPSIAKSIGLISRHSFPFSIVCATILFLITGEISYTLFGFSILVGLIVAHNASEAHTLPSPSRRIIYGILLLLILTGSAIRLYGINRLSLWTDEATSIIVTKQILSGKGETLADGSPYPRGRIYHEYVALSTEVISHVSRRFDIGTIARVANIPLYIIAAVFIFLTAQLIDGPLTGIFAVFFFSFFWFPISMAREVRFYEFFIAFFSILFYLTTKLFQIYFKRGFKNRQFLLLLVLIAPVYQISSDGHSATVLIFYAIILFGLLTSLIHQDRSRGILIFLSSFTILTTGLLIYYKSQFHISNYLFQTTEYWQSTVGLPDIFVTWRYFLFSDCYFVALTILLLAFLPIFFANRLRLWIISSVVALYSIVSLQGYGISAIRYMYILTVPLSIAIGIIFTKYLAIYTRERLWVRFFAVSTFSFLLLIISISGIKEGASSIALNSKNTIKNIDYETAYHVLDLWKSPGDILVTDSANANNYYAMTGGPIDYILLNDRERASFSTPTYPYTNTSMITEITDISFFVKKRQSAIFVLIRYPDTINPSSLKTLQDQGLLLFNNGVRIFVLNSKGRP